MVPFSFIDLSTIFNLDQVMLLSPDKSDHSPTMHYIIRESYPHIYYLSGQFATSYISILARGQYRKIHVCGGKGA
jgi:hypothetical protein